MMKQNSKERLRVGVFKFTSCDGCQLQLLDIAEELNLLRELNAQLDLAYFLEISSQSSEGPFDLAIVEGSITTQSELGRIKKIRAQATSLITIGACATSGGIQALRNWRDFPEMMRAVYARPETIDALETSTAIGDHVLVDFELRGCPVNKAQLQEVMMSFLLGKRPDIPTYSVCMECKRRGAICVTVAKGEPCLGPVTQAGCDAICPAYNRGCYGCYGGSDQPNLNAQTRLLENSGLSEEEIGHAFCTFSHTVYCAPCADEGPCAEDTAGCEK